MIELNLVKAYNYDTLDDSKFRAYLYPKATEKIEWVSLESLDSLTKKELSTNMSHSSAPSRMANIFIYYNCILRRHGPSWVSKHNPKMADKHFLAAVNPDPLRVRLESDLPLRHLDLQPISYPSWRMPFVLEKHSSFCKSNQMEIRNVPRTKHPTLRRVKRQPQIFQSTRKDLTAIMSCQTSQREGTTPFYLRFTGFS